MTRELKKNVARKWVDALRSGEYPRTRGKLRRAEGFCCLGVLCEVYRKETGRGRWDWRGGSTFADFISGDTDYSYLTREVVEWAGTDAEFEKGLAYANDTGKNFDEIASLIEKKAGLADEKIAVGGDSA